MDKRSLAPLPFLVHPFTRAPVRRPPLRSLSARWHSTNSDLAIATFGSTSRPSMALIPRGSFWSRPKGYYLAAVQYVPERFGPAK
jgi:hypothetical protein